MFYRPWEKDFQQSTKFKAFLKNFVILYCGIAWDVGSVLRSRTD
ncbi:mCG1041627 [Mus musculus]|nr:mCG1041627 [Mus musculus]